MTNRRRIDQFIIGAGRAFDIGSNMRRRDQLIYRSGNDALLAAWRAVGDELRGAMAETPAPARERQLQR